MHLNSQTFITYWDALRQCLCARQCARERKRYDFSFYPRELASAGISCRRVSLLPSVTSRCSTETAKRRITQTTSHGGKEGKGGNEKRGGYPPPFRFSGYVVRPWRGRRINLHPAYKKCDNWRLDYCNSVYIASPTSCPALTGRTECCSTLGHWHPNVWPRHPDVAAITIVTGATACGA